MEQKIKKVKEILKGESFNLVVFGEDTTFQVGQNMNIEKLMFLSSIIRDNMVEKIETGKIKSTCKEKKVAKKKVTKKTK